MSQSELSAIRKPIRKAIQNQVNDSLKQLHYYKKGSTNVYILLGTDEDMSYRVEDVIRLKFSFVYGFDDQNGKVLFETFTLIFNKKDIQTLYPTLYVEKLISDVFFELLTKYEMWELKKYTDLTRKGIVISEQREKYNECVLNNLYSHEKFLETKSKGEEVRSKLGVYRMFGDKFKKQFPEIDTALTTIESKVLLKAIKLATIGAISITALKKLFEYYQSRKKSSVKSKTSSRRRKSVSVRNRKLSERRKISSLSKRQRKTSHRKKHTSKK
jgi:hypothetical protein